MGNVTLCSIRRISRVQSGATTASACGADVNDLSPAWEHHRIEYSAGSLYDLLRRYFEVIRRPDDGSLPREDVFDRLRGSGVDYLLRMNPLVCERPIVVDNPYPSAFRRVTTERSG